MCSRLSVLIVLSASVRAFCYQRLAFDSASASSTYAKRSGTLGFGAQAAIQPGIGYWCSSGAHYPGQVVTWTGLLDARRTVAGMSVAWEYHPGEWKILASQDGSNFEELQQWQYTDRNEMKFEHTVMFPNPIVVRAITLVMRSPRPWQYFGLTRLTLLAAPGPVMIVSGVTADAGELCLAAVGGRSVSLRPCLQTIAIGDGTDIFQFSSKGQLENIGSHECVILNEEHGGKHLGMGACASTSFAASSRHQYQPQANGQVKLGRLEASCLTISSELNQVTHGLQNLTSIHGYGFRTASLTLEDCTVASQIGDASDKFFMMSVPEYDIGAATLARDGAALLGAATVRLRRLVGELRGTRNVLDSCSSKLGFLSNFTWNKTYSKQKTRNLFSKSPNVFTTNVRESIRLHDDASAQSIAAIGSGWNVDGDDLLALTADAQEAISYIRAAALAFGSHPSL